MTRVSLLDYGMGNLRSVAKALEHVGASVDVTTSARDLSADLLVVPGQGSFAACRTSLECAYSIDPIRHWIAAGRPYLGICLGMQILFDASEEAPGDPGLAVLPGVVRRLRGEVKVPHIGWNRVETGVGLAAFGGVVDGTYFYFDHSYAAPADAKTAVAWTEHGQRFASAVAGETWTAVQFHPEKSGDAGLALLENVVRGAA